MSDSDSEWTYDLDEVGEDAEDDPDPELYPGSPSAENAFFVALGVLTTLAVFVRLLFLAA
ncbi:hypothetical protein NGM10_04975 [Halorussus salilacus]|uniref:DUF7312 domain-containing protein n=1 Tax=Halorussus salilacus TaxID=2953750 RepID=UPI0020A13DAF|nr:hypothetical protein [Halorussus salilacus]USZ69092.1 hypothetical protein NGM10_04975 [Halorussus salilacus]